MNIGQILMFLAFVVAVFGLYIAKEKRFSAFTVKTNFAEGSFIFSDLIHNEIQQFPRVQLHDVAHDFEELVICKTLNFMSKLASWHYGCHTNMTRAINSFIPRSIANVTVRDH